MATLQERLLDYQRGKGGAGGAQEKITRFRSAKPTSARVETKPKMATEKVKSSDKNKREEEEKQKTS